MRLLVVGCGSIGRRHVRHGAAFADVGAVDADPARASEAATVSGARDFGADLDAGLEWAPAGVVVAVPHAQHIEVAVRAVKAGAHVLVEKPMATEPREAEYLLDAADAGGQAVYGVCNMRFHPAVETLWSHIDRIGRPLFARAHYGNYLPDMRPGTDYRTLYAADAQQGGVILDGIHELDYLTWLLGPIASITAEPARLSDLAIAAEDYAALILRHDGGRRSEVHLDYIRPAKRRGCEIVGSDGILDWISEGKSPEQCRVRLYTRSDGWSTLLHDEDLDMEQPFRSMMKAFVDTLGDGAPRLQTGSQALAVLRAAHEARGACP